MRHKKIGRKFGRERNIRKAFLKGLVRSFVLHGRIETTLPRAKETQRLAERLMTAARKGTLDARRRTARVLGPEETKKLFDMAPKYAVRPGGYTRITKVRTRNHDSATMAVLEFVD
ncbi:MAG: 50S ribosomal protein L17 [Candidatus Niyogibacteria bacterium]|nr:50S ribosomal protein L17 [Candidatus Niyogibacteria bacterium]